MSNNTRIKSFLKEKKKVKVFCKISFFPVYKYMCNKGGNKLTDQEIVQLLWKKQECGLTHLAVKYEKLVLHIIKTILGTNNRDVEECLNDTYLKIWNHIERFDFDKASLKTYIKVIARNTAINRLRSISVKETPIIPMDYSEAAKDYMENNHSLEGSLIKKEEVRQLKDCIDRMKKKDRELLIRKFFYLQSSKEIAKVMHMTVSAVDSRISRLRVKLKDEMKEGVF